MKSVIKLSQLSPVLIRSIQEIVNEQSICKLLYYNDNDPLNQDDLSIPADFLVKQGSDDQKIFAYPFNPEVSIDDASHLRIFYPEGDFKERVLEYNGLVFDIIVSKNLWLIRDIDNNLSIRPYEILSRIVNLFYDRDFGIGTKVNFIKYSHTFVNDHFDGVRLFANLVHFKSGKK